MIYRNTMTSASLANRAQCTAITLAKFGQTMKSMMINTTVLGLAAASSGVALAKPGEVTTTHCFGGEVQNVATSQQYSFGVGKAYGTVRTNPMGGLFDMMSTQCLGASGLAEGKPSLWGHCEWTDKDGDKVLLRYSRSDSLIGKMEIIHGTGKFSGIRGTRDYQVTVFPAIPGARAGCDEGKLRYALPD